MKLKLDDKGNVVVQDGKPVYVNDKGEETAYDAPAMHSKIIDLGKESQKHRESKEAAETKLKTFEGITDPVAAVKALETVKNLDEKKLIDAGEVQKIKDAAKTASEAQIVEIQKLHAKEITDRDAKFGSLETRYNGEKVAGAFSSSKFVAEKVAIPSDMLQARFSGNVKIEDGKLVAYYDTEGKNKVFSKSRPGENADFEEAIELLVEAYPNKEHILKGTGSSGTGGKGAGALEKGGHPAFKGKGNMGGTKEDRVSAIKSRWGKELA